MLENGSSGYREEINVLLIGDQHFRQSNIKEMNEFTEKSVKLAKERSPHLIVCLGDILDTHEKIPMIPFMNATKFLWEMSRIAPMVLLIGNHDTINNSAFMTEQHAFNSIKYWSNMTVVDITTEINIKGHTFIGVPYVPPGRFNEALSKINLEGKTVTCIFAHQEFRGCKMGAITSCIGDVWPLESPLVISGHIHEYDELQPNLYYIGTPIQHSFGDHDKKTVSMFKFFHSGDFEQERINLNLTRRILVRLNTAEVLTYIPPPGSLVKIIITGTSSEIKSLVKHNCIKTLTKQGVKIVYKHTPEDDSQALTNTKVPGEGTRQISYLERLYHTVKNDPQQERMYMLLFGKPQVITPILQVVG